MMMDNGYTIVTMFSGGVATSLARVFPALNLCRNEERKNRTPMYCFWPREGARCPEAIYFANKLKIVFC